MRFCIFAVLLFCTALRAEEYRADFDADVAGWSSESGAAVRRGTYPGGKSGALFFSAPARFVSPVISLKPGERYELKLNTWSEKPGRLQIDIREYDRTGRLISVPGMYRTLEQLWLATRFERRFVLPMTIPFDTSKEGGRIRIAVNKTGKEKNWIDDVVIRRVEPPASDGADACRGSAADADRPGWGPLSQLETCGDPRAVPGAGAQVPGA